MAVMLVALPLLSFAQSPEQTVRQYVSLLNDWLASPYSSEKYAKVLAILNGGSCAMKDEIVERYNTAGSYHCSPQTYLSLFSELVDTSRRYCKMEIVEIYKIIRDDYGYSLPISLKYSGCINFTTVSDFWISNGKIIGIVTNKRKTVRPGLDVKIQYVDLGLPSGNLWATSNLGANNSWEYGEYYAWGEVESKIDYSFMTYKYGNGNSKRKKWTKYCLLKEYGYKGFVDHILDLQISDDPANVKLGGGWHMPTKEDWLELKKCCLMEKVSNYEGSGVNGYIVRSKTNNSVLFLPAGGYVHKMKKASLNQCVNYWIPEQDYDGRIFYFDDGNIRWRSGDLRYEGMPVRPVCNK